MIGSKNEIVSQSPYTTLRHRIRSQCRAGQIYTATGLGGAMQIAAVSCWVRYIFFSHTHTHVCTYCPWLTLDWHWLCCVAMVVCHRSRRRRSYGTWPGAESRKAKHDDRRALRMHQIGDQIPAKKKLSIADVSMLQQIAFSTVP